MALEALFSGPLDFKSLLLRARGKRMASLPSPSLSPTRSILQRINFDKRSIPGKGDKFPNYRKTWKEIKYLLLGMIMLLGSGKQKKKLFS